MKDSTKKKMRQNTFEIISKSRLKQMSKKPNIVQLERYIDNANQSNGRACRTRTRNRFMGWILFVVVFTLSCNPII